MRDRDNAAKSVIGGPAGRETSGIRAASALSLVVRRLAVLEPHGRWLGALVEALAGAVAGGWWRVLGWGNVETCMRRGSGV
jgi:hypothetical protein